MISALAALIVYGLAENMSRPFDPFQLITEARLMDSTKGGKLPPGNTYANPIHVRDWVHATALAAERGGPIMAERPDGETAKVFPNGRVEVCP